MSKKPPVYFTSTPPAHGSAFATIVIKGLGISCFPVAEGDTRADRCEVGIVPAMDHRFRLFIFRVGLDGKCKPGFGGNVEVPLPPGLRLITIQPLGIKNEGVSAYAEGPNQSDYDRYRLEDIRRLFDLDGLDWNSKPIEINPTKPVSPMPPEPFPAKLLFIRNAVFYTSERSRGPITRFEAGTPGVGLRQFGHIGISMGADFYRGNGLQISFDTGTEIHLPNERSTGVTYWIYTTNFRPTLGTELPGQTDFLMYYDFIETTPPHYELKPGADDFTDKESTIGPCDPTVVVIRSPRTLCNMVWLSQTENLPEPR